jgi:hypothetical protein
MIGLKRPVDIPKNIQLMLDVHYDLWDFRSIIEVNGINYPTRLASHAGYNSVIIPGKDNQNYLWITQNLNKSTLATLSINSAKDKGEQRKVTWIINNSDAQFAYVGCVTTHFYPKTGDLFIQVVKFNSSFQEVIYSFDSTQFSTESIYS